MARALLFGKDGQLGQELQRSLRAQQDVVALGRQECDLANADAIVAAIRETAPDTVVNAAAYTAVDHAESEPELAFAVNRDAVLAIGKAASANNARVIHFSTDYVFDGEKPAAYTESDSTRPLNVYGASKLAGEQALATSGCEYLVFRTSWVYAAHGRNFVYTMLRLGQSRAELRVVDDQIGAPTSAEDLASAIAAVLAQWNGGQRGIYHMTAPGETTWAEFARAIFEEAAMTVNVAGIPASEYPTPARRPMNSRLNCDKLERDFGLRLPHWRASLSHVMREIAVKA